MNTSTLVVHNRAPLLPEKGEGHCIPSLTCCLWQILSNNRRFERTFANHCKKTSQSTAPWASHAAHDKLRVEVRVIWFVGLGFGEVTSGDWHAWRSGKNNVIIQSEWKPQETNSDWRISFQSLLVKVQHKPVESASALCHLGLSVRLTPQIIKPLYFLRVTSARCAEFRPLTLCFRPLAAPDPF